MTTAVRQLLDSFDALSETEKHQATVELLRRVQRDPFEAVPDEAFVAAAEELFLEFDAREAADANRKTR
jgi:hypothetical protein